MIANSITYGYEGKKLDLVVEPENQEVYIHVTNYGSPIPKEDLPYIFGRFYRGDKSRNRNTGSQGLRLAIAKSIAIMHGGNISVQSGTGGNIIYNKTACPIRFLRKL